MKYFKSRHVFYYIMMLVIVLIVLILSVATLREDNLVTNTVPFSLKDDGFYVYKSVIKNATIENIKQKCASGDYKGAKTELLQNEALNELIKKTLGQEYQFQDYIWIIQKSSVHTCHRDNNGDFFNEGQQHPSYTMLIYLEKMEKCLGVIPGSHTSEYSYITNILDDSLVNVKCNPGDVIIFNANLIHVGTLNERDDNLRIQMKVSHKDDIKVLSYYENFNKVLNQDNTLPKPLRKMQRNMSCMFPFISDLTQSENITSARGSDNGANIGEFQKMFSYVFYGNSKFYDLPNAF
jgi:hypothetical protein